MIPKVIHQIWVGGDMPDHLADYRATVVEQHPGWEHRLWGDDDFGWLINQDLFDAASEICPGHEGQLRSDIARYEILARHGGVYIDCDIEALAPLDDLLVHGAFAGWEQQGRWVNNAVLGAEAGHLFVDSVVRSIPASVEATRGLGWRPNRITGPHLVTPIARRLDVHLVDQHVFYPYSWNELDRGAEEFPGSLLVHHWENQRKLKEVPRG